MGRAGAVFLSDGTLGRSPFRGSDALYAVIHQACQDDRDQRFATIKDFYNAWRQARSEE